MEEARVRKLRFLALQLVGAVAVIHLVVGLGWLVSFAAQGLLVEYLTRQLPRHPRAFLFLVSGIAVLAGIVATARGHVPYRLAYGLAVVTMLTYTVGWVAWHTVLDHGVALGGGAAETGHSHGGLLATLYSHYVEPLVATVLQSAGGRPGSGRVLLGVVSKTLELAAVAVLLALLRVDPRARSGAGGHPLREPE